MTISDAASKFEKLVARYLDALPFDRDVASFVIACYVSDLPLAQLAQHQRDQKEVDNEAIRAHLQEVVVAEHAALVGKVILVNSVTGYLGDTDDQVLDRHLDPPVAFIVNEGDSTTDLRHWTDGGWLDPYWDLTPVNPADSQIADMRSFWCFGPSHNVDGSVNKDSPFVVAPAPVEPRTFVAPIVVSTTGNADVSDRSEQTVWRLTAADLDAVAGRVPTDDELERIAGAIGFSSIPEAISEVVNQATKGAGDD